jgi:hypothetical protein
MGGVPLDARGDLFSLGCVLYAMVAGQSPFHGSHSLESIHKVCEVRPRRLEELERRIPADFSSLVERLLEKDPKDRPQTADEVAGLLRQQLARANQAASNSVPELPSIVIEPPPARRRWPWILAIPAASLVALAGALLLVLRTPEPQPPRNPVSDTAVKAPTAKAATVPTNRRSVTVAKSGRGDFETIHQALDAVAPGGSIRVLDNAAYEEPVSIDDRERWGGVTLESTGGAAIVSTDGAPALTVRDTPGVTVRGFGLTASPRQHALLVDGATTGLTLEELRLSQPGTARFHFAAARIAVYPPPDAAIAVIMRRCRIENQGLGIGLLDPRNSARRIGGIRLLENEFSGPGVHVLIAGRVEDVILVGNRFLGGKNGVNLNFSEPSAAEHVVIANNTFFATTYWLGLVKTVAPQKSITVWNNLIIDSQRVEWGWPEQLEQVAQAWDFRNNWWELSPRTERDQFSHPPMAEAHEELALRSRDPSSPDFLRPEPGSALATSGLGPGYPTYIGALAPATELPK